MNNINCLLTRKFWKKDIDYLEKNTNGITFIEPKNIDNKSIIDEIRKNKIEIFLGDNHEEEILNEAKDLKLFQIPWNGIEKIDLSIFKDRKINICNSHSNSISVAELAVSLLLSCIKQIPIHDFDLRKHNWRRPGAVDCVFPDLLSNKKVLIVGYGSIGKKIHQMLSGFELEFNAIDMENKKEKNIEIYELSELSSLLPKIDIIIISIPLTPETVNLFNKRMFLQMKKTSYLINVSRGEIVSEVALYQSLKDNLIAGAAQDTWYKSPPKGDSISSYSNYPFEELENIILSPHRGGMIRGELPHFYDVVENLNRYVNNNNLINIIDIGKGF